MRYYLELRLHVVVNFRATLKDDSFEITVQPCKRSGGCSIDLAGHIPVLSLAV